MGFVVAGFIAVVLAGVLYWDRANLKAKLAAAEAAVASKLENIESAVKADVRDKLNERVVMVQAWAVTEKADVAAVLAQIDAHIRQVLAGAKKAL